MNVIVPTDQQSIYAAISTLDQEGTRLALVRPNNPPPGIAGFLLDVEEDNGVELESDITDNYTEDNTAIQDHIALRPEVVTTTGAVSELVLAVSTTAPVNRPNNPLPPVPGLEPQLAPGAQAAQDTKTLQAAQAAAVTDLEQSLWGYYQAKSPQQPKQTKQSLVYGYFYQLWLGRQLFSVETPWGFFTNMAIQSLAAKQPKESKTVTDFSITFKKIRTAGSIVVQSGQIVGRAVQQQADVTQQGFAGNQTMPQTQVDKFFANLKPSFAP